MVVCIYLVFFIIDQVSFLHAVYKIKMIRQAWGEYISLHKIDDVVLYNLR